MRVGLKAVILSVLVCGTLLWQAAGQAQSFDVSLERTVRDDDRGVRAIIRYRPEVMTGGQSEVVNSDGSVSILHWDGLAGQFEAELVEGSLDDTDAEAFLREAVIAVCPSADAEYVAQAWVQVAPPFLRLTAQCPEHD